MSLKIPAELILKILKIFSTKIEEGIFNFNPHNLLQVDTESLCALLKCSYVSKSFSYAAVNMISTTLLIRSKEDAQACIAWLGARERPGNQLKILVANGPGLHNALTLEELTMIVRKYEVIQKVKLDGTSSSDLSEWMSSMCCPIRGVWPIGEIWTPQGGIVIWVFFVFRSKITWNWGWR